jgi:ribosomal protein S18 acetylase RimI-like enzyme
MAAALTKSAAQNGLQPVDLSRHLGGIAELIELCFRAELDAAGRGLIREMQWLSRAGPALRLLQIALMGQQPWSLGFVWVEGGRVVGSVSTQRAAARSATWLVANVAVHPDHRRHGIALAMMRATLDLIRREGGREAILQVDDDNLAAVTLYRDLGFTRVATRTNWVRSSHAAPPVFAATGHALRLRGPNEWAQQFALAALVRPEGLTWGHPLRPEDFRPGALKRLDHLVSGRSQEHWVLSEPAHAAAGGRLIGSLTIHFNGTDGDRLGLLVHPDFAGQLERPLLVRGLRRLGRRPWTTRVEYAADDDAASAILTDLGFQPKRTLRWMRLPVR